jgi:hypothetical protein
MSHKYFAMQTIFAKDLPRLEENTVGSGGENKSQSVFSL